MSDILFSNFYKVFFIEKYILYLSHPRLILIL